MNSYPNSVTVRGREYAVNSDFRNGIKILTAGDDEELSPAECLVVQFRLFFRDWDTMQGDILSVPTEFIQAMTDWMRCGKAPDKKSTAVKTLDYESDFDYIVAAFQKDYGIDLVDDNTGLHWWRFNALLNGLSEDNMIVKIVGYRAADLTKIKDKALRKFYADQKRKYALKDKNAVDDDKLIDEIIAAANTAKAV